MKATTSLLQINADKKYKIQIIIDCCVFRTKAAKYLCLGKHILPTHYMQLLIITNRNIL